MKKIIEAQEKAAGLGIKLAQEATATGFANMKAIVDGSLDPKNAHKTVSQIVDNCRKFGETAKDIHSEIVSISGISK